MIKKQLGTFLMIFGILLIALALLADTLGIPNFLFGSENQAGFGPFQLISTLVGVIIGGVGWFLKR